jgi:hypothetical protein
MNSRIGAAHTIAIEMAASWLSASQLRFIMAGRAGFNIFSGSLGMDARIGPRIPIQIQMAERQFAILAMTFGAESFVIVAVLAFEFLALSIEAMIETIIESVNCLYEVVTGVAVAAEVFAFMARLAAFTFNRGIKTMSMFIIGRMNKLGQFS